MTNQILIRYSTIVLTIGLVAMVGILTAQASEVTGTLSSQTSGDSQTSGSIGGTVSDNSLAGGNLSGTVSSGSSGSGGSSGGSGGSSDTPDGAVLGATDDNLAAPNFPNAGTAPDQTNPSTPWSRLIEFLKNAISF